MDAIAAVHAAEQAVLTMSLRAVLRSAAAEDPHVCGLVAEVDAEGEASITFMDSESRPIGGMSL
jgi:hypothetical protein